MCKSDLTPKERSKLYFSGHEVDHTLWSSVSSETACVMYGISCRDFYLDPDAVVEVEKMLVADFDTASVVAGDGLKSIAEGLGSVLAFPEKNISYVEKPVVQSYDILPFLSFDPYKDGRFPIIIEALERLTDLFGNERTVETNVGGPLTVCSGLRGTEQMLKDMRKHPEELHKLLDIAVDATLTWVETAHRICCPSIGIVNPVASGSLVSIKNYLEFEEPYLKRLVEGIKRITGTAPGMHMCGKSKDRWESFKRIGIAGFSVDNCENLEEVKEELGSSMFLSGNIPPVEIFYMGTPEDVIRETVKCLQIASDSPSGYSVGSGCELPIGVPLDNLKAFDYAVKKYGAGAQMGKRCRGLKKAEAEKLI